VRIERIDASFGDAVYARVQSRKYRWLLITELDGEVAPLQLREIVVRYLFVPEAVLALPDLAMFSLEGALPLDFRDEGQFPNMSSVAFFNEMPKCYVPCRFCYAAFSDFHTDPTRITAVTRGQIEESIVKGGIEEVVAWSEWTISIKRRPVAEQD
jgi:hypothetical protein